MKENNNLKGLYTSDYIIGKYLPMVFYCTRFEVLLNHFQ
jgi:hypothetical protein